MAPRRLAFLLCLLLAGTGSAAVAAEPQWMTLPDMPTLPQADASGTLPVNGIKIWYASFGKGEPVILLHGGLANSAYWGEQVPALAQNTLMTRVLKGEALGAEALGVSLLVCLLMTLAGIVFVARVLRRAAVR